MIGTVLKSAQDKTLTINHQMGKIVLHSAPSRESGLRVRRLADNTLDALGRDSSGAWSKDAPPFDPKFLAALLNYLIKAESVAYWYINKDVAAQVNKRFARSK